MSSTTTSSTTTQQSTLSSGAGKTLIQPTDAPSVVVQSQLATSTVAGETATKSNLTQVIGDLGAAHTAHAGWLESETQKINEWGQREIQRLLSQTKGVEERLIADAQTQQKVLEEKHKGELSRLVQELDAKKTSELKALEDGLQRQIQAALESSKKDINSIESEMNKRKMDLMAQAQAQTAKDVDRLSSLAVSAKLVPSVTRTVIETNTETGTVVAVAGGGKIETGGAAAQTINQSEIRAIPADGKIIQETDVTVGTMNRTDNGQVVGTGAIVDTQTRVTPTTAATTTASSTTTNTTTTGSTVSQPITTTSVTGTNSGLAQKPHIDAAYGRPLDKTTTTSTTHTDNTYDKTSTDSGKTHKEGLLSKVKHAITGEPKTSKANSGRV